ncbi:MAG: hypothetical protein GY862_25260 [Gammaproteobacteria bacterium]|nr:hypothetical protein [Gammaproteobacteria bacterium]
MITKIRLGIHINVVSAAVSAAIFVAATTAMAVEIPAVYSNITETNGRLYLLDKAAGKTYPARPLRSKYTLEQLGGNPEGTNTGIAFDFGKMYGALYYELMNSTNDTRPLSYDESIEVELEDGKADIDLVQELSASSPCMAKTGRGTLAYRLEDDFGRILYDGRVSFTGTGPFRVNVTFIEGPFVNRVNPEGAVISFDTNVPATARVEIDGKTFSSGKRAAHHEIVVSGLKAQRRYPYTVTADATGTGQNSVTHAFHTAPKPGARNPFSFAYTSDSRSNGRDGEESMQGVNVYMMKKVMAVAQAKGAAFVQFSGDMINGYLDSPAETRVQYRSWKRAIERVACCTPVYTAMGNHESVKITFNNNSGWGFGIDRFPFASDSAEAVFAGEFVNPENGPASEDGSRYDPDPQKTDFPSYLENVYYYTYDNIAVIVLNSDYFYAPALTYQYFGKPGAILSGGNLHGYLMDNQLAWLKKTLDRLNADDNIDFIFTTQHSPVFPNSRHLGDDMWYYGNNKARPVVAGAPVEKGIIERRDEYLRMLLDSPKAVAILTGDEHNYARFLLAPGVTIHPPGYDKKKLEVKRTLWQINNGGAGAPPYGQWITPWSNAVRKFSAGYAVTIFHVRGKNLRMEVVNPDTLTLIEEVILSAAD